MSKAESVIFLLLALDTFGYLLTLLSSCSLSPFSLSWTWCSNQGAELIYQVWWWQGVHCALVGGTCLAWMHCCRLLPCCKVIIIKTRLADADCAFEVQTSFHPPSILQSTFLPNLINSLIPHQILGFYLWILICLWTQLRWNELDFLNFLQWLPGGNRLLEFQWLLQIESVGLDWPLKIANLGSWTCSNFNYSSLAREQ